MARIAEELKFITVEAVAAVGGQVNQRNNSRNREEDCAICPVATGCGRNLTGN